MASVDRIAEIRKENRHGVDGNYCNIRGWGGTVPFALDSCSKIKEAASRPLDTSRGYFVFGRALDYDRGLARPDVARY
jgi:hypothetical protein